MRTVIITPPDVEPVSIGEQAAHMRITLDEDVPNVKHNLRATSGPLVTDDETAGYAVGSLWRNTATGNWFKASDVGEGAAVWGAYEISPYDGKELPDIEEAIRAGREYAEHFLGRAIIEQTRELRIDGFPVGELALGTPPVSSVVSVTYVDTDGDEQAFTDFEANLDDYRPAIRPLSGKTWPATKDVYEAVRVRFVCGYGPGPSSLQDGLRRAVKMLAAEMYERREHALVAPVTTIETTPVILSAEMLMWPYRVVSF